MSAKAIKTITQIEGLDAETLLKKFDELENQIKTLKNTNVSDGNKLITRKETSDLLGVSLVTLNNWTKSGILTAYRIGKKIRYKEIEVLQALQNTNPKK